MKFNNEYVVKCRENVYGKRFVCWEYYVNSLQPTAWSWTFP